MQKTRKISLVLVLVLLTINFAGCIDGELDVSRLMEKPLDYSVPRVKSISEDKWGADPEILEQYEGYYIDINPVQGDKLRLVDMEIIPQLILEAYYDSRNVIEQDFKQDFDNTFRIFNADDELVLQIEVSSDGTIYARKDKNSPVFRIPDYAYYAIEACLWNIGDPDSSLGNEENVELIKTNTACSLIPPLSEWSPSMGTGAIELRLEHDIKTLIYQMYGYSEAVFINYKIYSDAELDRRYKLYMLLSFEGYEFIEQEEDDEGKTVFWPRYREIIPVQVVYSWVEGDFWFISDLKFAEYREGSSTRFDQEDIRSILPYLDTQTAIEDLTDTHVFEGELQRQALGYITKNGYHDIEIEERK